MNDPVAYIKGIFLVNPILANVSNLYPYDFLVFSGGMKWEDRL